MFHFHHRNENSYVTIRLYDPTGRAVRTIRDEFMDTGTGVRSMDVSTMGLAAGTYTVRVIADGSVAHRMIVILPW